MAADPQNDAGEVYVKYVGWVKAADKEKLEKARAESERTKHMLEG